MGTSAGALCSIAAASGMMKQFALVNRDQHRVYTSIHVELVMTWKAKSDF